MVPGDGAAARRALAGDVWEHLADCDDIFVELYSPREEGVAALEEDLDRDPRLVTGRLAYYQQWLEGDERDRGDGLISAVEAYAGLDDVRESPSRVRGLLVRCGLEPETVEFEQCHEGLRELIGGDARALAEFPAAGTGASVTVFGDDEAELTRRPVNDALVWMQDDGRWSLDLTELVGEAPATMVALRGDLVVVGSDDVTGCQRSLRDDEIDAYTADLTRERRSARVEAALAEREGREACARRGRGRGGVER